MKQYLTFFLLTLSLAGFAQEPETTNHGTVTIKKAGTLHSILFDDVNFRLVGRDVYGNILDSAVVSFDLDFTVKGIAYSEKIAGNTISIPMQQRLSRLDGIVVLMFSNIKAKERNGTITAFPSLKVKIGVAREQTDN